MDKKEIKIEEVVITIGEDKIILTVDQLKKLKQEILKLLPEPTYYPSYINYDWKWQPSTYTTGQPGYESKISCS